MRSFGHKGRARFFQDGDTAGIQPAHAKKLQLILGRLHAATKPWDMNHPGHWLYKLSVDRAGTWAVDVRGNWRVTFQFSDGNAEAVNDEDYH